MKYAIRLLALSALISNMSFAEDEYIPGEFIISNPNEILQEKTVDAVEEASGKDVAVTDVTVAGVKFETEAGYAANISTAADVDVCKKLKQRERKDKLDGKFTRPLAKYCERNAILKANLTPNDTYFNATSLWGLQRLNMQSVWDKTTGSSQVVVGVIDSGINYAHPDLQGNVWTNTAEIPGNNVDDDQNGYIDDVYGANFINNSGDPMDDNGHGTHVSGTIGGRTNNGVGISGVNWNVKLMGLKFLGANGSGSLWGAINALAYAKTMKQRGVNVVLTNNSWGGGGYYYALYQAIQEAQSMDMLFVAAAGNSSINSDADPQYPAAYDLSNIISVAAIDNNGAIASFSNYGATTVDIGAPGVNILSTYPNNTYVYLSGTSMACPHVAGAAALLKSYSASLTSAQIRAAILNSATPNAALNGKVSTNGELNINGALGLVPNNPLVPGTPTPTPTATNTALPTVTPTSTPVPATPTPTATPMPGKWTLRILSELGTGLSQVGVTVTGPNNFYSAGTTLTDGTLSINSMAGGTYTAQFVKSGYTFQPTSLQFTVNGDTVSVVSAVKSTYQISGTIMNKLDAVGVSGATIDIFLNGSRTSAITTASDGTFTTQIPFGESYRLEVRKDGYYPRDLTGMVLGKAVRVAALMPE